MEDVQYFGVLYDLYRAVEGEEAGASSPSSTISISQVDVPIT